MTDTPPRRAPIEIRTNLLSNGLMALPRLGLALLLGGALVYGAILNGFSKQWFLVFGVAAVGLGFGIYYARDVFDRRVQLILTEEGLRDPLGADVLVPWHAIAHGKISALGGGSIDVIFTLKDDAEASLRRELVARGPMLRWANDREVVIDVGRLDITPEELLRTSQTFAPHIEIDTSRWRLG
jgi:hypothetical protein